VETDRHAAVMADLARIQRAWRLTQLAERASKRNWPRAVRLARAARALAFNEHATERSMP